MSWQVLVLDQSFQPHSVVDWTKAVGYLLSGEAEIVHEYDDVMIRSEKLAFKLPSVLRLLVTIATGKASAVKFSRYNIFFRDKWKCQYCGERKKSNDLTFDHVIPKCTNLPESKKSWENIVTACVPCNRRKGGRRPEETGPAYIYRCPDGHKSFWEGRGKVPKHLNCPDCEHIAVQESFDPGCMKLRSVPRKPDRTPTFVVQLRSNTPAAWRNYIYWHAALEEEPA